MFGVYLTMLCQLYGLYSVDWEDDCGWRIEKDVQGNCRGLICDIYSCVCLGRQRNTLKLQWE